MMKPIPGRKHRFLQTGWENYARALGIKGWKNWDMIWEKPCRGGERLSLEELNQYRQWMLEPLKVLRQAFKEENATISSVTTVLRQVLESMKLEEKLESFSNYFLERKEPGDENRAREYSQVYERVMELLERLEGLLGDEKADMKNYIQILDAGFEEIKIGVLPATADQVMIGDITRSRLESVKVLFFTGVNEGIVPQRKAGGSLLNDGDREVFKSLHMELAPTAREEGLYPEILSVSHAFQAFQAAGDHLCGYEWSGQKLPSFQSDRGDPQTVPGNGAKGKAGRGMAGMDSGRWFKKADGRTAGSRR